MAGNWTKDKKNIIISDMILFKLQEFIFTSVARRDRIILMNVALSILMNVAVWLAIIYNFWLESEYITLHYNIYFGISALGPWYALLVIPLLGLVIIMVNFLLSLYFYLKQQILSYFLTFGMTVVNLIMLVAVGLIIYINL